MSVLPVGIGSEEAAGGYQIERSLRFNSADTAHLTRTGGTSTNRKIHTFSLWTKYSVTGGTKIIASAGSDSNNREWLGFDSNSFYYQVKDSGNFYDLGTTQVLRDPSAWYHLVVAVDTTQATSSNRVKMYINGVQVTAFSSATYPLQNDDLFFNDSNGGTSYIGALTGAVSSTFAYPGYLTEFYFIDGQALAATDFGEFNEDTGVWQPKAYTGSYGTNGFYLDFADNTSTTTLGYDESGNNNDWTLNNFSVTAGAGNDSLVDSPTRYGTDTGAGGEVRGSYCTLNPLDNAQGATLSNGNLQAVNVGNDKFYRATFGMSSGKWYWEVQFGNLQNRNRLGITDNTLNASGTTLTGDYSLVSTGNQSYNTSTGSTPTVPTFATNDYICFAFDADAGTLYFEKNATPNISTSPKFTGMSTAKTYFVTCQEPGTASTNIFNFGQRPFAYTAPSGFLSLCTTNLPEPTIADGSQYFDSVLWTGNSGSQTVTSSLEFQPDFLWTKVTNTADSHVLRDIVRDGSTTMVQTLRSNSTIVEYTASGSLTTSANGFSVSGTDGNEFNYTGDSYVTWLWKAGGSGVTNTDGSITSTVSANTTSGVSIVTYTGTGSAGTVGHGLGVAPGMIIVKARSSAVAWQSFHQSLGKDRTLQLNETDTGNTVTDYWGTSAPNSTVFGVIGGGYDNNLSGVTTVAYCFAPVAGFSSMGSYVGNGSSDGPFVYTGFRPAYLLVRRTDSADDWSVYDNARSPYNQRDELIYANSSNAETTNDTSHAIDFLSNGFKCRGTSVQENASGGTYIYMALAENPFALSLAL